MKKRNRRDVEAFSMSFLDAICCGFGAIVLLLVLSKTAEPFILEETTQELEALIANLQEQLYEIRGETTVMNRTMVTRKDQLAAEKAKLARLQGDLSRIRGQFEASRDASDVADVIEGRLATARQSLSAEMQRLLGENFRRKPKDQTVGGIPVDSEYIIFIIDTSGSMVNYGWDLMMQKVEETLQVYPNVKGIQVMNDMGDYMFSRYAGKWIPDTPARRKAIMSQLKTWTPFSNSSPVEGITKAIRTFYSPEKKISLYVLGDEFTGGSIERVIDTIDRINREDDQGNRLVRIHSIGFPVTFQRGAALATTGTRFATLMRILCEKNGGTFVGLNTFEPEANYGL
ncbi:MAG: VWA domain-containing protein [Gammaproteobacteria bacterium]